MTEENKIYDGPIWRKGKKTILRPLQKSDAHDLQRWINDPANNQYLNIGSPVGLGFEEEWIEKNQAPSTTNIVVAVCTHDGTFIGVMGLHSINLIHGTATTGANLGSLEHQGKGYGSDAKMMLLDFAFNELGLHKVQSRVIAYNKRSVAYSKKCGYVEEGTLKDQWFRHGTRHDEILLAVFRDAWLPLWEEYKKDLPD